MSDEIFTIVEETILKNEDNIIPGCVSKLSQNLCVQREKLIEKHIGDYAFLLMNSKNMELARYPNGREVYSFKGNPVLEFYPLETDTFVEDEKTYISVNQPFRVLGDRPQSQCSKCYKSKSQKLHTCPYKEEIRGDETLCDCCDDCKSECNMEI